MEIKHSKVDAQDGSAVGYVAWDRKFLYIAAVIKDSDTGATADPSTGEQSTALGQYFSVILVLIFLALANS